MRLVACESEDPESVIKNIDIPVSNFYHTKSVDRQSDCLKARIKNSHPIFLLEEIMRRSSQKVPITGL